MGGFIAVLLAVGVVGAYWKWILVAVVAVALWRRLRSTADGVVQSLRERAARHAALVADADEQHALVLAGDPRGIHGRYPPTGLDGAA